MFYNPSAIVLADGVTTDNIFYRLCPTQLLMPMIVLATVATVIASQSIITGAFSMTRQAIQLGWFPRLKITQTSAEGYGQIYVGPVNWLLMVVTIALTIGFRRGSAATGGRRGLAAPCARVPLDRQSAARRGGVGCYR
jgi:KUP system potassium uptake protein